MKAEIEKKANIQNEINRKKTLDLSYINYHNIIDRKLPYKFNYLNDWLLKESKLLLNEASIIDYNSSIDNKEEMIVPIFKTYGRGTIIKVDFGIGIGSEMSQIHFVIVMNNYDNPKNSNLTVIPLTSKKGKFNVNLGNLFDELFLKDIMCEINLLENKEKLNTEEVTKLQKLNILLTYYSSYKKIHMHVLV